MGEVLERGHGCCAEHHGAVNERKEAEGRRLGAEVVLEEDVDQAGVKGRDECWGHMGHDCNVGHDCRSLGRW